MPTNPGGTRRHLLQQTALAAGAAALAPKLYAQTSEEPAWKHLFPAGFRNERIKTSGAEINTVIGGSGPPVLLFHGAPQSLITWRLVAPDLAKDYTLVMCDLRGYGDSSKPEDQPDHSSQSSGRWRWMASRSCSIWATASSGWWAMTAAAAWAGGWRWIIPTRS